MSAVHLLAADAPATHRPARLEPGILADIAYGLSRTAELWRPHLAEHPIHRSSLRLLASAEYDAWLLGWPPGTAVSPHDHGGSVGAFAVVSGELTEIRWRHPFRLSRVVSAGGIVTIDRGTVHDVVASGTTPALSVHAYSPPLSSMRFYDDAARDVVDVQPVTAQEPAVATTRALHPARQH